MKMKNKVLALIYVVVFALLMTLKFDIVYGINDDLTIESMLSGSFSGTPNFMTYYFGLFLGIPLSFLYRVLPMIPWYPVLLLGVIWSSVYFITLRVFEHFESSGMKKVLSAVFLAFVFAFSYTDSIVMLTYTTAAAVSASAGVFLIITARNTEKRSIKPYVSAVIFCLVALFIRKDVFLMASPLMACSFAYKAIKSRKIFAPAVSLGILVFVTATNILVQKVVYSAGDYESYIMLNADRTTVYDYMGVLPDEGASDYFAQKGITPKDTQLCVSYNLLLSEKNMNRMMSDMAGYYDIISEERDTGVSIRNALSEYFRRIRNGEDSHSHLVMIAMYGIVLILCLIRTSFLDFIFVSGVGLFRSILWVYLIYQGRYPHRVTYGILLLELFAILGVLCSLLNEHKKIVLFSVCTALCAVCCIAGAWTQYRELNTNYTKQLETNEKVAPLYRYMNEHSDGLFFLDVYSSINHTSYAIKEYRNKKVNYYILGGWLTGHPIVDEVIRNKSGESVRDILLNDEKSYIVMSNSVYWKNNIDVKNALGNLEVNVVDTLMCGNEVFTVYETVK